MKVEEEAELFDRCCGGVVAAEFEDRRLSARCVNGSALPASRDNLCGSNNPYPLAVLFLEGAGLDSIVVPIDIDGRPEAEAGWCSVS